MAKKVKCLVLLDEPAYGLKCGQVVELDKGLADHLLENKRVDVSAAAVGQGGPVVDAEAEAQAKAEAEAKEKAEAEAEAKAKAEAEAKAKQGKTQGE